jgi:hypothetical protein
MQPILLAIFLNLLHSNPQHFTQKKIDVEFTFTGMRLGKPTLATYTYDITIKNNEDKTWYVAFPHWLEAEIERKNTITRAAYRTFGEVKGITLYCANTITLFQVQPGQQIKVNDFQIETFDEKIQRTSSTMLTYAVFNRISIAGMTLPDFMANKDLHDDELEYLMTEAYGESVTVQLEKQ